MASILATATRRVARPARPDPNQVSPRGAHRWRAGDGFALAPDAERALAAEEGWLSERGGSCPGPPPTPAAVPCSISAMVQGRLGRPDVPRPSARHRGTAVTAQPGCPPPGDKRSPTIRTGAQRSTFHKEFGKCFRQPHRVAGADLRLQVARLCKDGCRCPGASPSVASSTVQREISATSRPSNTVESRVGRRGTHVGPCTGRPTRSPDHSYARSGDRGPVASGRGRR
jgi:hypothetical protein